MSEQRYRCAKTGAYVAEDYAKAHPDTTIAEVDGPSGVMVSNHTGLALHTTYEDVDGIRIINIHLGEALDADIAG